MADGVLCVVSPVCGGVPCCCPSPLCLFCFPLCCVWCLLSYSAAVWWCVLPTHVLCVVCLGVCYLLWYAHCRSAVWCCIVEVRCVVLQWGVVCGGSAHCVLSCFVVSCCGLWNGGVCVVCGVCSVLLASLPLSSLSCLCVGVRGSARAALRARTLSPNTTVSFLSLVSLPLFLSAPRLSSVSVCVCLEWRCVFTMCRCVVLA